MKEKANKAIILVRVSTKEQKEGHSIEVQKHRLIEYCQRKNLVVIQVFEIIESSSRGDRRKFKEMIKFAENHKILLLLLLIKLIVFKEESQRFLY